MSKKLTALILALLLVLTALAGCVKTGPKPADTEDTQNTQDTPDPGTDTAGPDTAGPKDTETNDTADTEPEPPFEQKDIDSLGIGETVYGFALKESREFPVFGAVVYRFEHEKTGAELIYIANDDINRIFDLTFFTRSPDNTGIPHVFEHATACGSEKYPSKNLFFNLAYQTYNVYMNAWTGKTYTSYPVASLSEEQLLKYADFYTDCCFNPIIMTDESIFRQEAWRYRLPDADSELTIEGTVYSEMKGAYTLSRAAYLNYLRNAYPGSYVGNDQGGDPALIPDMTWDSLKDFHNEYYHPSNCAAYLYGDLENYSEFFKLLDGYFSVYEKKGYDRSDNGYERIGGPVSVSLPYPVEAQSPTENESVIFYAYVIPGLRDEPEEEMIVSILADLIYDSSSKIQMRLDEEIPHGAFSMFLDMSGPDDSIVFYGTQLNPGDEELFCRIIDEGLAEIAENGFSQEQIDGVMSANSISNLLARETTGADFVESIFMYFLKYHTETGNCWAYQDMVEAGDFMDEWNREGRFAEAAAKWLVGNDLTVCVTTYPQPGQKEIDEQALKDTLAALKESMTEEELNAIIEASNAEEAEDDASEYVAQLQAVTVDALPEEIKEYTVYDDTDEDGIRFVNAVAGVDGIGQVSLFLDAAGLPQEQYLWFKLFTYLIGDMDTESHTRDELQSLINRYLYSFRVNVSLLEDAEKNVHPYLRMSWISLDDDLDEGYDLMKELVFHTRFDDAQKLSDKVGYYRNSLKSSINANPYQALVYRVFAAVSPLYSYYTSANFLDLYDFLGEVETMLAEDPDAVIANLNAIADHFNNRTNSAALFAGNEESIDVNMPLAKAFLMDLDEREIVPQEYEFDFKLQNEALIVEAGTVSNVLICPEYELLGIENGDGGLEAITALVTDKILLPVLRDQYGVYDVGNVATQDLGMYVVTLSDPNLAETFGEFDKLYDYVSELEIDQETLNGYILSSYSYYALPAGELSGAIEVALSTLSGEENTTEEYLKQLKSVTPDDLKKYADIYRKLSENGVRCSAGSASVINQYADMFDSVLNPFNAVDYSQVEYTDFGEEYEYYEAVRYCLESGLLPALSDTEFGVDEPATYSDLYGSTYVLLGENFDPEACKDLLVQYGMAKAKTKLESAVKTEDIFTLYSDLTEETVEPTTDKEGLTRGEFAKVLYDFVQWLESDE